MKSAKLFPATFTIICPYCGSGDHADPDIGSFYWTADQIDALNGGTITCDGCAKPFTIPKARYPKIPAQA